MATVTLKQIASQAGVSRTTAGKVLLGSGGKSVLVGKEKSERIRRIADELGYKPNLTAQALAGKNNPTIAILIDSMAPNLTYQQLIALEKYFLAENYLTIVGHQHDNLQKIEKYVDDFKSRNINSLISFAHNYENMNEATMNKLLEFENVIFIQKPTFYENDEETLKDLFYVDSNFTESTKSVTEYHFSKGRRKVAILLRKDSNWAQIKMRKGYIKAHENFNIAVDERLMYRPQTQIYTRELIYDFYEKVIKGAGADAVIADDETGIMLISLLKSKGIRVPEDIAVSGMANTELGKNFTPSLTTIDFQEEETAKIAVRMMLNKINNVQQEKQQYVEHKLIIRESA